MFNWYNNNVGKNKPPKLAKPKISSNAYKARDVIKYIHSKEIKEIVARDAGPDAGSKERIKYFPAVTSKFMKTLTEEEMEDAERTAEKWNNERPPRALQQV